MYNNYKLVQFATWDGWGIRIGNNHDDWWYLDITQYEKRNIVEFVPRKVMLNRNRMENFLRPKSHCEEIVCELNPNRYE